MLNIYLTNLGKYNEGQLIGEWLELPATQAEIEECLARIGISDEPDENGIYYEEYFITDYETDVDGLRVDEYANLDELNELAEAIEGNEEAAEVLIYHGYDTAEEIKDNLDNVVYVCTPKMWETDEEAIAYWYIHEMGCLEIPEYLENYFDYERYGRDLMIEGTFHKTESGNIYELVA